MINCAITSPNKTETYQNLQSIALPAYFGQAQILSGHAEAFILLKKGNIVLGQSNRQDQNIPITSGECHIKDDLIAVVL